MNKEQKELDDWYKEKGWSYWSPHAMLARLIEEVGEFARLINHEYGPKPKKASEQSQNFSDEIGDILYTLVCFANTHDIDLDEALKESLEKVKTRDKDRFKQ
ncbi:MAG: nucleotide pyrophosphohydrolase [Patescibacteria group bacterium]